MTEPNTPVAPVGPHPAAAPKASPVARWITVLAGLAFLGGAVVIGHDVWVRLQEADGQTEWLPELYDQLTLNLIDITWVAVAVGIVVMLVGLALVIASLKPRQKTHLRVQSPVSIWTRPVDIARKSTFLATSQFGANHARTKADRNKLTLTTQTDVQRPDVEQQAHETLVGEFQRLEQVPAITIKTEAPAPVAEQEAK